MTVGWAGSWCRVYNRGDVAIADQPGLPLSGDLGAADGGALPVSPDVQPVRDRRDRQVRPVARGLASGAADLPMSSVWGERV